MRRLLGALLTALLGALVMTAPPAAAVPGAPYAPEYWFPDWHVPHLWTGGARGQGITIGEIDTGVQAALGVFGGRVVAGKDFGQLGGDGRVDRDKDPYGHGTSMASIMIGAPGRFGIRGLAPAATVLPVAIPLAGTTDAAADDRLPEAIRWAADHGARIISMSLGGVRRPSHNRTACPDDEQQAIFHALRKGALVLAAGGNRGRQDDAVEEPGVCLGVVSVGAIDRTGAVAPFSSRHRYLTLSAPGVDIASVGPGGAPFSGDGTSQATAIASAAAALVWSKYPKLSAAQLLARLLATLDRRSATRDPAYGYGIINPARAIRAAVPADAPDPVYALARPFMARAAAHAVQPAAPKPAPAAGQPPGSFDVGSAPRLLVPRVLWGLGVAAAGLLLLLGLLVGGLIGRRRRAVVPIVAAATEAAVEAPPEPPGTEGLEWREIRGPERRRPDSR